MCMIRIKDDNGKVALFRADDTRQRTVTFEADTAKVKRNTKQIGIVSELVAMQHFAAAGFLMCIPFGDCAPYDLILDDRRGRTFKVQVKTGRLRRGVVIFNCVSNHAHRGMKPTEYVGVIDAFAVYCPDNDEFYVVPIDTDAVTRNYASLRLVAPANNMRKTIKWACHYRYDASSPDALNIGTASNTGAAGED